MPSIKETTILNLPITRLTPSEALKTALEFTTKSPQAGYACFVNVHTLTDAQDDTSLNQALKNAEFRFADGMPLVWASKLNETPLTTRTCGPDFMKLFCEQQNHLPQGFIGSSIENCQTIRDRYQLTQATLFSPPYRPFSVQNAEDDWGQFQKTCETNGLPLPKIIWVGLGAPKQELWMEVVSKIAPRGTLFLGVGAAFDFLAGTKSRAPIWMQKNGLEWVHRLASEPRRLFSRYAKTNSRFLYLLVKERLTPSKK